MTRSKILAHASGLLLREAGLLESGHLPNGIGELRRRWEALRVEIEPDGLRTFTRDLLAGRSKCEDILDQNLVRLAKTLELGPQEVLTLAVAVASERDVRTGRALAALQDPIGRSSPTVGLLGAFDLADDGSAIDAMLTGVARRTGILVLSDSSTTLAERTVLAPPPLVTALLGIEAQWPPHPSGPPADRIPMPAVIRQEAGKWVRALEGDATVAVRSGMLSEGRTVAFTIARRLRRTAVFVQGPVEPGFGPWLTLTNHVPIFVRTLAPSEQWRVPDLPGYDGPRVVVTGHEGSIVTERGAVLVWQIPVPGPEQREQLWRRAIGLDEALSKDLATAHRHGAGRISELGRLARQRARVRNAERPVAEDVSDVAWLTDAGGLEALTVPLRDRVPDEALVRTESLAFELGLLEDRCRQREGLARHLGVSSATRYRPGVRALLVGPSGTGKTLAAGWLATRLGTPAFRVDVAAVMSKYIGETEKNLAELMERAETADVILLFDEADSLFGKRTDVKQSTDRFANAQTNYLLQRIENYEGVVLLTSNSRGRFDEAFARRLDMIIEFPRPGPDERRSLWLSHLGKAHGLSAIQLNQLAAEVDLVGGHIRNATMTAAVVAMKQHRDVSWEHIAQGVRLEYRKLGKQAPAFLMADDDASPPPRFQLR